MCLFNLTDQVASNCYLRNHQLASVSFPCIIVTTLSLQGPSFSWTRPTWPTCVYLHILTTHIFKHVYIFIFLPHIFSSKRYRNFFLRWHFSTPKTYVFLFWRRHLFPPLNKNTTSNKSSTHPSDTSSFHSKFFPMPWARLLRGLWLFRSLFRSRSFSRWVLVGKDGLSVESEKKTKMNDTSWRIYKLNKYESLHLSMEWGSTKIGWLRFLNHQHDDSSKVSSCGRSELPSVVVGILAVGAMINQLPLVNSPPGK